MHLHAVRRRVSRRRREIRTGVGSDHRRHLVDRPPWRDRLWRTATAGDHQPETGRHRDHDRRPSRRSRSSRGAPGAHQTETCRRSSGNGERHPAAALARPRTRTTAADRRAGQGVGQVIPGRGTAFRCASRPKPAVTTPRPGPCSSSGEGSDLATHGDLPSARRHRSEPQRNGRPDKHRGVAYRAQKSACRHYAQYCTTECEP